MGTDRKMQRVAAAVLLIATLGCTTVNLLAGGSGQPPNLLDGGDDRPTTGGGVLSVGESAVEQLEATYAAHNWTFEGAAGQTVVVRVSGVNCDPRVTLLDPDGEVIGWDDDGGDNFDARLVITLPRDGTYTARVDMLRGGIYTISVQEQVNP